MALKKWRWVWANGLLWTGLAILGSLASSGAVRAGDLKVAIVFDKGGKDDRSFNNAAYRGAMKAKEELHTFVKFVEATDDHSFEPMVRAFAQKDFDLIIGVGIAQAEAIRKVAAQFPQKHFAIVDSEVQAPNVRSLLFEEHEGSYLVGAIAALTSKTGKIGFVGGMDIPLIRRFEKGYAAGARKVRPDIRVVSNFIGITGDAWNNPAKAKELAVSQYSSGVDVVFAAAGASNSGLFDAAEERKKFAIGVDSNQNYVKPGYILTSMLKRVDVAVFETCKEAAAGKFQAGTRRYGLADKGVDYAVDSFNEKLLPAETLKEVEKLKKQILSRQIQVPDHYKAK
jgi:basic membrane protein A